MMLPSRLGCPMSQKTPNMGNTGDPGPVRTYVKRLRRKLGDDPDNPAYIFTKRRVGYWMVKAEGLEQEKP